MGVTVDVLVLLQVLGAEFVIVVLVVAIGRHHAFDDPAVVVEKARLRLVEENGGSGVRRVDRHLTVADIAAGNDFADEVADIPEFAAVVRREMHYFGADARTLRLGQDGEGAFGCPRGAASAHTFVHGGEVSGRLLSVTIAPFF